ncbi:MAG: Flagellar hook-length control protein FliK [Deltaproteobacteria bacterium]|nr:Flagellar hook-length control protein FliK [Deltaproteobacteria bacterium]
MQSRLVYKNSVLKQNKVQKIIPLFIFIFLCAMSILLATEGRCAQVTLAWDKNSESNIAGYRIYYGTGSRSYNWFIDVGNATTYTITGLADGSTYYFAATAYDKSKKESKHSSEISYNSCTYTISPTTAQLAQQGGTGTVQVSTQKGCTWTASSSASWVTITEGNKGSGIGKVSYSAKNNSGSKLRTAAFTIARSVFTVNQAGSSDISDNSSTSSSKAYMVKVIKKQANKGAGVVKSYDRKIDCGEACSSSYKQGSVVTFLATPDQGSTFTGWAPASLGCEGTGPCRVSIDNAKKVQARFVGDYELNLVNISKDGGKGRVTSSPWSLDCRADNTGTCEARYRYNREVSLSAYPSSGSTFLGWSPARLCPGTDTCVVTMDKKRIVKALFRKRSED